MPEIAAAGFVVTLTPTEATGVTISSTCAGAAEAGTSELTVSALDSWPDVTVQVSFTESLDDDPVWTDVTDDVYDVRAKSSGRNYQLDRTEAGEAVVAMENRSRDYEPTYSGSPYYPYVLPGREIRIRAEWLGTTYDLWRGRVQEWPLDWGQAQDAIVTVEASDGFEAIARPDVTLEAPKEWSGQRIARLLDAAGWPADARDLDLGQSYVIARTLEAENALAEILSVAETELGTVGIDGAGTFRFIDRATRADPPAHVLTLGDDESSFEEMPYVSAPLGFGMDRVYTEVAVTRTGGYEQRAASDDQTLRKWGRRVLPRSGLWTADVVAAEVADHLLELHEEPRIRFEKVTLDPVPDPMLWQTALGTRVGDVVRLIRRPPGGGSPLVQDCWVESVEHRFRVGRSWQTVWTLTAAFESSVVIPSDGVDVPVNTSDPRVSGSSVVGQTLRITTLGRWYDETQAPITFGYRWQVATPTTFTDPDTGEEKTVPADGTIADVPGASAYTYTIAATYQGKLIRAAVDGRNVAGLGTGYSDWEGPITLEPPPDTDEPPTTDDGGGGDGGGDTTGTHTFVIGTDVWNDPDARLG